MAPLETLKKHKTESSCLLVSVDAAEVKQLFQVSKPIFILIAASVKYARVCFAVFISIFNGIGT